MTAMIGLLSLAFDREPADETPLGFQRHEIVSPGPPDTAALGRPTPSEVPLRPNTGPFMSGHTSYTTTMGNRTPNTRGGVGAAGGST